MKMFLIRNKYQDSFGKILIKIPLLIVFLLLSTCLESAVRPYVNLKGQGKMKIYNEGNFEEGLKLLQQYLRENPEDVEANFICGLVLRDCSPHPDFKQALKYFQKALKKFDSAFLLGEVATTYFDMNDSENGNKYLELSYQKPLASISMPSLSDEERRHGEAEFEKMVADLPEMKLYAGGDLEIKNWAVAAFAGKFGFSRTWWAGIHLNMENASAISSESVLDRGGIDLTIKKIGNGDSWKVGSEYWANFVFETLNNEKRLEFTKNQVRNLWDGYGSDSHSAQSWLLELDTYRQVFQFYLTRWRPFCERSGLKPGGPEGWNSFANTAPWDVVAGTSKKAPGAFNVYRQKFEDKVFPLNLKIAKDRGISDSMRSDFERQRVEAMERLAQVYYFSGDYLKVVELVREAKLINICSDAVEVLGFLSSLKLDPKKPLNLGCNKLVEDKPESLLELAGQLESKGKNFLALQVYEYLSGLGIVRAKLKVSDFYSIPVGTAQDYGRAREELEQALKLGSVDAGYALAQGYLWGSLGPIDPDKALEIINKVDDGTGPAFGLRTWAYSMKGPKFKKEAIENAFKGAKVCDDYSRRMYEYLTQKDFFMELNCNEILYKNPDRRRFGYPEVPLRRGQTLPGQGDALLIDDFESGTLRNRLGGTWHASMDDRKLGTEIRNPENLIARGGADGSSQCAHFEGHFGKMKEPWPFASVACALNGEGLADLRDYKGLEFMVKGDGKNYEVSLNLGQITDFAYYKTVFKANKSWQKVHLDFVAFKQPDWGRPVPLDLGAVKELVFAPYQMNDEDFDLYLDNVKLVK